MLKLVKNSSKKTNSIKIGKVKVRIKRLKGEELSKKEYDATLKTLQGPFGRMDNSSNYIG